MHSVNAKGDSVMVSFHTADSWSILGMLFGVVAAPIAILVTLFTVVRAAMGI
jgi:hypothetical protein